MPFSAEQIKQLQAALNPKLVKRKPTPGNPPYIPGYVAIEAANRIFGFDGWGYTVDRIEREDAGGSVLYSALVTVRVEGCPSRQDIGVEIASVQKGGQPPSVQALETALKGAVTDGIKRALRAFGDQFGSVLYDKDADINKEYTQWLRDQAADEGTPTTGQPSGTETLRADVRKRLEADPDAVSKLPKPVAEMNADELAKSLSWLARRARTLSS